MHMINVIFLRDDGNSWHLEYQLNVPSKERMTEFLRKENEVLYNKV